MLRLTILRILTFLGILVAISVAYIGYHLLEMNYYLFGASDVGAYVEVWLDKDGDGRKGEDEPPLEGICVWAGYASYPVEKYTYSLFSNWEEICQIEGYRTDASGKWSDFFAGGTCNEIHILVKPPEDYRPTTPLAVNDCSAEFGLTQDSSLSKAPISFTEEYLRRQVVLEKLKQTLVLLVVAAIAAIVSIKLVHLRKETENDLPIAKKAGPANNA